MGGGAYIVSVSLADGGRWEVESQELEVRSQEAWL